MQHAALTYLRSRGHKATFSAGEEELKSMTTRLEEGQVNGQYMYYANGILSLNNIEVIMMKASSAYEKAHGMWLKIWPSVKNTVPTLD